MRDTTTMRRKQKNRMTAKQRQMAKRRHAAKQKQRQMAKRRHAAKQKQMAKHQNRKRRRMLKRRWLARRKQIAKLKHILLLNLVMLKDTWKRRLKECWKKIERGDVEDWLDEKKDRIVETCKKMKKPKVAAATIGGFLILGIVFLGGTFAWQSISQEAVNEVAATSNPGGRLHDDFTEVTYQDGVKQYDTRTFDKDIYVENFTKLSKNGVSIYARIRLDEYMEFGQGAGIWGENGEKAETNLAVPVIANAKLEDKSTWSTYKYQDTNSPFRRYWQLSFGGGTVYMPTFNKNIDSIETDVNGTFEANFADHVDYDEGQKVMDDAFYLERSESGEVTVKKVIETHKAVSTPQSEVISMKEWLNLEEKDKTGDYWVYDNDGWAYWANPIESDQATGLLLDQIMRTEVSFQDDWYYAINVVAQFITYDDIGVEDNTGFYDSKEGVPPSKNALKLLKKIGVLLPEQ